MEALSGRLPKSPCFSGFFKRKGYGNGNGFDESARTVGSAASRVAGNSGHCLETEPSTLELDSYRIALRSLTRDTKAE